jgi:hypothetical protein
MRRLLESTPLRLFPPRSPEAASAASSGPVAATTDGIPGGGDEATTDRRRERDLLVLGVGGAILAFVMVAVLWMHVPVYRPVDEASHVSYARELTYGRLPTIHTPMVSHGDPRLARVLRNRDAAHSTVWTANHPPLYYALVGVPLRIGSATGHPVGGVYAARLLSVGFSALGLVALAFVVVQLAPGRPQLAVAATGLVALLPSFTFVSAVVQSDSLGFLTATAALAAAVVFVVRGPSGTRLAAVAAASGLAALTRASGLLVVAVAGLAVLVGVWRASEGGVRSRLWRAVVWAAAVGATVVAVAGWFYLRNRTLYGDLTGSSALLERFGRAPGGSIRGLLTEPGFWRAQQRRLWDVVSDWPSAHGSLTRNLWLLGLAPLAGLLLAGARWLARLARGGGRPDPARTVAVGLCVLLLGLLQLSVVRLVADGHLSHPRYLFPGLATVGLAAAVGLAALPGGRHGVPVVAMLLAMATANLWVCSRYLDLVGVSDRPALLVMVMPVLLLGLALQAVALWRLRLDAGRPVAPRAGHRPETAR